MKQGDLNEFNLYKLMLVIPWVWFIVLCCCFSRQINIPVM